MLRRFNKRFSRFFTYLVIFSWLGTYMPVVVAQPPPMLPDPVNSSRQQAPAMQGQGQGVEEAGTDKSGQKLVSLSFRDAPLDQILQFYGDLTGRTMIKSPGINATITIKGQTRLTVPEALVALESVLAMNNVVLVPMGDKFFKVVQPSAARQEGMSLAKQVPEKGFTETDTLISQVITLKYIEIADAQAVIQSLIHGYGKIQPFERINSLLITDTASNLKRIMEVLELIDQPTELKVETRIYELKYAEAAKIASRLNELIADAQAKEEKPRVAVAGIAPTPAAPPGVIRARQPLVAPVETAEAAVEAALAEKGIIQGKVKIIADDRTNILIVISRPSNFIFFDKIVAVLDRPVEPEIIVRVVAMEYADAEQISGILNEFIGVAKAETAAAAAAAGGQAAGTTPAADAQAAAARSIEDFVKQRAAAEDRLRNAGVEVSKIGQLSPNTKILADKRTNSLLLMGTKGDVAALEEVIDKLDIMLAQVLIEAVILEVNLSKSVQYGVDWLQRSMTIYQEQNKGPGGGISIRQPLASYGGSWSKSVETFKDASLVDRTFQGGGGLSYFLTLNNLNLDAVIQMVANSGDARVLSTPVILTTDNTEASINSSEQRPVVTQTSTTEGGQVRSSYEYRDIGIKLKVKPRINPARYVVLDITQTADTPGEEVKIDNNSVPRIFKRELQASVAVQSRSTIVLGGLVQTDHKNARSKVPILGDIPILGALFREDSRSHTRTELLVLIT
ncbi:MAG: type II secretion system secretin GspD, partial [Lentisphaerota bacterium]